MKSPIAVRKFTTPIAMPLGLCGPYDRASWKLAAQKWAGSGMIRFVWKFSPPNGGEFRSGKVTETPVTGSTAVQEAALPALSAQVWKCMVSVGPMLMRIRKTSTLWLSAPLRDRGCCRLVRLWRSGNRQYSRSPEGSLDLWCPHQSLGSQYALRRQGWNRLGKVKFGSRSGL